MKLVMRMKKALTVLLSVLLILVLAAAGVFFWKGGHHALYLADRLEDWLAADAAGQHLTLQVQAPGYSTDAATGRIEPGGNDFSLTADSFWTEYTGGRVYGLGTGDITVYLHDGVLYMDTGRAYTLPDLAGLSGKIRELQLGLLLYGRVTRDGDSYRLSMQTDQLELTASVTVDSGIRDLTLDAVMPDGTVLRATLTPQEAGPRAIPQAVTDAMVLARMEPPMALTEPLEVLLPAAEGLFPLSADLTLGVECGILELSETVGFTMDASKAELERDGVLVTAALPGELSQIPPAALALGLLRSGAYTHDGSTAVVQVTLPAETTGELCAALVPQVRELGMTFNESQAVLTFAGQNLTAVSLAAEGTVPFFFTTIPVAFSAEFVIR